MELSLTLCLLVVILEYLRLVHVFNSILFIFKVNAVELAIGQSRPVPLSLSPCVSQPFCK